MRRKRVWYTPEVPGNGKTRQLCLLWLWVLTIRYRKFLFSPAFRVIYNEVIQTSKYYMRDVTAIESAWLLELAPHFYQQGTVGSIETSPQNTS